MRLNRKGVFLFVMIALGMADCMPPVYYTAEVETETSFIVGSGYIGYGYYYPSGLGGPFNRFDEGRGGRIDFTYRYAGDPKGYIQSEKLAGLWQRLAINIQGGVIFTDGGTGFDFPDSNTRVLPLLDVGLQYEFCERPSISAGISTLGWYYYGYPSLSLMAGLPLWPGGREIITVGMKTLLWMPYSAFVSVHPLRRLHLSVQTNPMALFSEDEWEIQAAVGINLMKKR